MSVQGIYLDTSAIVKRYVIEEESTSIDVLYREAHAGKLKVGFSIWNVGEVAVALDKYEKRRIIENAKAIFLKFVGETRLLAKLNQLKLVPLNYEMLINAIRYVFKHGIYIADAVQLASAKEFDAFLTYDEKLARLAEIEGLRLYA